MREGILNAAKDWMVLALTGIGINFAPHQFWGGMFPALSAGMAAGVWLNKSCYREIDDTQTNFFIAFDVDGPGASGVLVSKPVCTVVGTDLQTAMTAT